MLFDADLRRYAALLEKMPAALMTVHRWSEPTPPSAETGTGHLHAVPTLITCLSGVVRAERLGARIDLHPGEALVIAPGVWHLHAGTRPGSVAFGQGFMAAWSDLVVYDHRRSVAGRIPLQPSRMLLDQALATIDDQQRVVVVRELLALSLSEKARPLDISHPALAKMVRLLWSRLHRGVTAEDLVRVSGLARSQAYSIFAKGYGVSPRLAIARGRLDLAVALIKAGLPASEVADRCGFPSRATFTRAWKRAHGQPPSRSGVAPPE